MFGLDKLHPWPWLAGLIGIAALLGLVYWSGHAVGYGKGQLAERETWQTEETRRTGDALIKRAKDEQTAREGERAHQAAVTQVTNEFVARLHNEQLANARLRDALRRGDVRLRLPAAGDGGGLAAGGAGTIGASAGRGDGGEAGELSPATSEAIYAIVDDADIVAEQLRACQQLVLADRALCGQR